MALVAAAAALVVALAGVAQQPPLTPTPGYRAQHGDCGYPVCATLMGKGQVPHKTVDDIAAICNATEGCEGFNTNGWLKGCLPPRCPQGGKGLEPKAPCNLYTKIGPPKPVPPPAPPAPVPDIDDAFYPAEEQAQSAAAAVPTVVSVTKHSCVLRGGEGEQATAREGEAVFGGSWHVLSISAAGEVAMERRWERWSLLVLANAAGRALPLRRPLGHVDRINSTRYDLTAGTPDYFKQAASDPRDYIGQRIIGDSVSPDAEFRPRKMLRSGQETCRAAGAWRGQLPQSRQVSAADR